MLEELSKEDSKWRLFALKICNDKSLADDIVNDMYLKLHDSKEKKESSYIYRVMVNIYNDYFRKQKAKLISLDEVKEIKSLPDESLEDRYEVLEMIKPLDPISKEILMLTHEMSLRKAEEECGVKYYVLKYHKNKLLKQLRVKHGKTER